MDDTEQAQLPDESEEQIIPLDGTPVLPEHVPDNRRQGKKFKSRRRALALRLSVILALLLLIVLVIPTNIPGVRDFATQLYNRIVPPPLPTLAPGVDSFYFDVNVPWEAITIDGHAASIPRIGIDRPLVLARGEHLISWQATPFREQSCMVSMPPSTLDTCVNITDELVGLKHIPQAQLLALHESIGTEPPSQYAELLSTVQQALTRQDATTIVQPGEMYFGPQGYTIATQPLHATLRFSLDMNASGPLLIGRKDAHGINGMQVYSITAQDCQILCSLPRSLWLAKPPLPPSPLVSASAPQAIPPTWFVLAFASETWDYTTMQGNLVAHDIQASYTAFSHPVLLGIVWDGSHWYVSADFQQSIVQFYYVGQSYLTHGTAIALDPACAAAQDNFSSISAVYSQIRYISSNNVAGGCLVIAKWNPTNGSVPSPSTNAEYFYRFGVFYTVNTAAWQFDPEYVRANSYEQQLARQLAQLPGVTVNLG